MTDFGDIRPPVNENEMMIMDNGSSFISSNSSNHTIEQYQAQQGGESTGSQTPDGTANSSIVASISTPFSRHLGRNRACASCRERKLKCDGIRPICGQCSRAWNAKRKSMKGKGISEEEMRDMEKPCIYLDVTTPKSTEKAKVGRGSIRSKPSIRGTIDAASGGGIEQVKKSPKVNETPLQEAQRERKRLERELAQLKERFGIQDLSPTFQTTEEENEAAAAAAVAAVAAAAVEHQQNFQPNSDELSIAEVLANTMRSGEGFPTSLSSENKSTISDGFDHSSFTSFVQGLTQNNNDNSNNLENSSTQHIHSTASDQIDPLLLAEGQHSSTSTNPEAGLDDLPEGIPSDPLMQLVLTGWPSDFPPPSMVDKLIGIFFENYPHLRYLFHPVRFFENLSFGPTSPRYPHPAILHSIFALAYVIRPDLDMLLPKQRADQTNPQEELDDAQIRQVHSSSKPYADPGSQAGHREGIVLALQSRYDRDRAKMGSSGYHSERASYHIRKGMWEGGNLMAIAQASLMLTAKRYGCGEIFDAWMGASTATRLATCLTINRSDPTSFDNLSQKSKTPIDTIRLSMAGAPVDWIEEEERRRLMFLILATDRVACASTLWANSLDDADVNVELPRLSNYDFVENNVKALETAPRQTLQSPNFYTEHHIDGFNTMIKASMMMGEISTFLARLSGLATAEDMTGSPQFERLQNILSSFTLSLPFGPTDLDERGNLDIFRFATYALLHTNTLLLHSPLIRLNAQSAAMCEAACHSTLNLLRILISAGIDFCRLPPLLIFCLGTVGKALVRRLQTIRGQTAAVTKEKSKSNPSSSSQQEINEFDQSLFSSTANRVDQFNLTMHAAGPYTWSFIPTSSTTSPFAGGAEGISANSAGLGGVALSPKEEKLRGEIDLIFTYLCKMGNNWSMAIRQAQTLAQMLGIDTSDPIALRYGIFFERNHSNHSYGK